MKEKEFTYVDLGLPSGRLWASENAEGYYTYDEAKAVFGELLPKPEAFQELWEECQWLWDVKEKRMVVVGPNQNTVFLPASGYRGGASGGLNDVGSNGYYWSYALCCQAFARLLNFDSGGIYPSDYDSRAYYFSVRPCRELH